ncbi:MAG: glutamate racemase [Herbinix sp.]|nr:glutamate racemase [Herbinix sp.]
MKIGIFDSGIGGLTVLHQALITLPKEDYIYYADTDNVPYGTKTREEIIRYVDHAVDFLVGKGVKAVVIACNTATSTASDYVRNKYTLPILGMEPAVKPAVARSNGKRVMVIATPVTVREEKLRNLIRQVDDDHRVDLLALPGLVKFAEAGEFEGEEVNQYLRREFSSYDLQNYSALILGCTHFNYFKDSYRKIFPKEVAFIDGSVGTVNYLKRILVGKNQLENNHGTVEYYMSGRPVYQEAELAKLARLHQRLDKMLKYK